MKRRISLGCALLVCLAWMPAHAQVLYDTFSGGHIDPAKWIANSICGANAYDCAREVRLGHLRLAVRGHGDPGGSTGVSFARSQLLFRDPEAITTIQFRFVVTSFSSQACADNPEDAHPQLLAHGAFFRSGDEDVLAYLMVERLAEGDASLPAKTLRVGAFMSKGNTFFNNVDLGTVKAGEPAIATLTWEPENSRFLARVVKTFTRPSVVEQTMVYSETDDAAPATPLKSLRVGTFAPNCTNGQSFAAMEAHIDDVRVNQ